jgi:RNA polymerase sigma-70 factor, ECF subfamily
MKRSLEEAFLEAFDAHADALFRFCYAHIGERETAKDMVQESFSRTWRYLAQGRSISNMRPFLYRTARNAMIDRSRKAREDSLDKMQEDGFDAVDHTAPDPLVSAEAARAIQLASSLDPQHREVILLRYVSDMSPRDIAQVIGVSENAVSVRLHRALGKLRTLMGIPS